MASMTYKFFSFLFIYIGLVRSETQPGLRIGISDEGVLALESYYAPDLIRKISDKSFEGPYYNVSSEFYGKFELNVSNVKINIPDFDYKYKAFNASLNNNNIILKMIIHKIYISFDFKIKSDKFNKTSKGNATLSKVKLTINESLYSLKNNHSNSERYIYGPGLLIESIDVNKFDIEVKFDCNSTLENLIIFIVKSFGKDIKDRVNSTYCLKIRNN